MKIRGPYTDARCTRTHGERPLGRLYGVSMGRGIVRLSTDKACPIHNEHRHVGPADEPCQRCGSKRKAWIHPETRREPL